MANKRVGPKDNILSAIQERDFPRFLSILDKRFNGAASRAARHTSVHKRAAEVFGTDEEARRWLREPAFTLDHQRPIDLLESDSGAQTVMDLLHRLEQASDV